MAARPNDDHFDPFAELQLSPEAEPELIKAAFKALAKKYHPDRFSDPAEKAQAERRMARINEAQRLLQSGNYRPPQASAKQTSPPPEPQPEPQRQAPPRPSTASRPSPGPQQHTAHRPKQPRKIPMTPFVLAGLLMLAILSAPNFFGEDHLKKALELERNGKLQQSLEQLNKAVADDPYNRELYVQRARLWEKLGEPDRAAIDLKNAQMPSLGSPNEEAQSNQVPGESTENSSRHVPRT